MELTKDKTEILNVYCKGKLQIKFSREQRIYFSTFDSISIFDNKTSNNRISRPHESSEKQIRPGHFLKSTSKTLKIFTMRFFLVNFNLF